MSPLVAGTRPAKSGMEALGLSPSRRRGPPDRDDNIHDTTSASSISRSSNSPRAAASRTISAHPHNSASTSRHPAILHEPSGWRLRVTSGTSGRHNLLSVSIMSMTEHHLLRPSSDDSKPGPGRRAHLTHGPLAGCPEPCRSPPPALSARDPPRCRSRLHPRGTRSGRPGPAHDAARRAAPAPRNFAFSCTVAPAGTSPVSRYFHSATSSLRATATTPTFRSRAFPAANRR